MCLWRIQEQTHPSGPLLQMTTEVLGYSTELEWLVNVSTLPPCTQKEGGSSHILGKRSLRETANSFQRIPPYNVSGSSAPGDAERIFDWLAYIDEKVQALAQWVTRRYVVEKLIELVSDDTCLLKTRVHT